MYVMSFFELVAQWTPGAMRATTPGGSVVALVAQLFERPSRRGRGFGRALH